MRSFFKIFLAVSALFLIDISVAKAEIYYWQDPVSKISITVPDTWRQTSNQKPDDVLTFVAPGFNDHASCRLRVREDRRFVVYPARFSGQVQRLNYSKDFWDKYASEFEESRVNMVTDNASFGRGFASYADISFVNEVGLKAEKRALSFVSLYNDKAYVLECSTEVAAYDKWHNSFLSIAKSVNFRKEIHEFPAGNYRDYMKNSTVRIENERPMDVVYY
jgi:hypothetical protein